MATGQLRESTVWFLKIRDAGAESGSRFFGKRKMSPKDLLQLPIERDAN